MQTFNVGICIPNYNMEKTLSKTIESVLNQTYKHITIYIIDNNSSDLSWNIIKKFKNKYNNINIIKNNTHLSMEENWNKVLRFAHKEDYVNILSTDDVLEPLYVESCVNLFKYANSTLGYVYSERYNILNNSIMKNTPFYNESGIIKAKAEFLINIKGFHTAPCQLLINNTALKEVNYLSTKFGVASDMHLTLKLNIKYDVGYINSPLVGYNVSSGMSSNNKMSRLLATLFYVLKHDIIINYTQKEVTFDFRTLEKEIQQFCSKYCIIAAISETKQKNYISTKELILLASSFDKNISTSKIFLYILEHDIYGVELLEKYKNILYPMNNKKQPYSLPKDSITIKDEACLQLQ